MEKVIRVVVDTSIFVNPDSRCFFGETPFLAFTGFLGMLKEKKDFYCYMPPGTYQELMKFMDEPVPAQKEVLIDKKPPSSYQSGLPALFLYELIEETRARVNKGLRIAEKYARKGISVGKEEETVKALRDEYRVALREGIIDSSQDCDLMLLAKELGSYLATSDNGLVKWAAKLGITCISASELKEMIK